MPPKGILKTSKKATGQEVRETALKHAVDIENKRQMRNRVADLVIEAYDLPSSPSADPGNPSKEDFDTFLRCLELFQPSDLDDLVSERNIDSRCGYALCPKPHRIVPGGGEKVWNQKSGKNFQLHSKAEIEKWCSDICGDRTVFMRAQLNAEPAWLRDNQNDVKLLDKLDPVGDLAAATKALSLESATNANVIEKLQELSLERGETEIQDVSSQVQIIEKKTSKRGPGAPQPEGEDSVEGHIPRNIRFKNS